MSDEAKSWQVDRRIPLALIFALALQTAGLIVWGTQMTQRVEFLEQGQIAVEPYGERLARIEVLVEQNIRMQEAQRAK